MNAALLDKDAHEFLTDYEKRVSTLSRNANLAFFEAKISGSEKDYEKAFELQLKLSKIYADRDDFKKIGHFKDSPEIHDRLLKRQIDLLYNVYAGNQYDNKLLEKMLKLSTRIEEEFSTFQAEVRGKKVTDNEVDEILLGSTDSQELEEAWKASKEIGELVAEDVIKLIELRNSDATKLGYKNYHHLSLSLSELKQTGIESLFNELERLTRVEYTSLKEEIDEFLSKRFDLPKDELMPWHYQGKFFESGPKIYDIDLNSYYADKDVVEIAKNYFGGIGLDIAGLIEKSDLYEKEGKYQSAFCTGIDRDGDIRVLCNVRPDHKWMVVLLHEFGHAVYDKYLSKKLPWPLREPAHIFATEAIAMLFGRFASDPQWLCDVVGISYKEKKRIELACFKTMKMELLIFVRWSLVMYWFEKAMYENPHRDLNALWWKLIEKYQFLKKPAEWNKPDWASKIHLALYPVYYHNYLLGEVLASQLYYNIVEKVLSETNGHRESFSGNQHVGSYLKHLFFSYGSLYHWSELIKKATGEKLNPKYFIRQITKNKFL